MVADRGQTVEMVVEGERKISQAAPLQDAVFSAIVQSLAPDGRFVTFTYVHSPWLPAGRRVRGYTLEQDLVPSLLELLGYGEVPAELKLDGRSSLALLRGERPTNYSEFYITECTWMRKRGWRTPEWKLIEALEPDFHSKPPVELYKIGSDSTPVASEVLSQGVASTMAGLDVTFVRERQFTGLIVAKDPGAPFIWLGCLFLIGGTALVFFFPSRRVWALIRRTPDGSSVAHVGAVVRHDVDRFIDRLVHRTVDRLIDGTIDRLR